MSSDDSTADTETALQFRLSTLFVVTLAATILAAFLNPRGEDHMMAGAVATVAAMALGFLVGTWFPPRAERVFWGMVIAAMMQAVAAEVILYDRKGILAWPLAAGFAAVFAASRSGLYRRMIYGAATSSAVIGIYMGVVRAPSSVVIAVVGSAAIGGALLPVLIEMVRWIETRYRIPQPAIGLTLVIAAIGFSVAAPRLIPGW
ncbi:hypothetical protein [Stieleria varia]|uniref:Uncharacterized protein n=1 Tax=Stieleria varia TaxID=2528005 RepID=A0A5C6AT95_9BACT|nr:hypothetical protein [Stieleria varia]TWU02657.1 hypothetical protein Pla52n_37140 [Stieleria varia]